MTEMLPYEEFIWENDTPPLYTSPLVRLKMVIQVGMHYTQNNAWKGRVPIKVDVKDGLEDHEIRYLK